MMSPVVCKILDGITTYTLTRVSFNLVKFGPLTSTRVMGGVTFPLLANSHVTCGHQSV